MRSSTWTFAMAQPWTRCSSAIAPTPSCTWRRRATWTVPSMVQRRSCETNLFGTYELLQAARRLGIGCPSTMPPSFAFCTSRPTRCTAIWGTDELFRRNHAVRAELALRRHQGRLGSLVRAWGRTYGLPVLVTNCSNNYGPYQFPEKLIPHMILNALRRQAAAGLRRRPQVRDWLYVEDHARALWTVLEARQRRRDLQHRRPQRAAQHRCGASDLRACSTAARAASAGADALRDSDHVRRRIGPGHDRRYAIDAGKIERELGWRPAETFETGLEKTVRWYLENRWLVAARARRQLPPRAHRHRERRMMQRRGNHPGRRLGHAAASRSRWGSASSCCRSTTSR